MDIIESERSKVTEKWVEIVDLAMKTLALWTRTLKPRLSVIELMDRSLGGSRRLFDAQDTIVLPSRFATPHHRSS